MFVGSSLVVTKLHIISIWKLGTLVRKLFESILIELWVAVESILIGHSLMVRKLFEGVWIEVEVVVESLMIEHLLRTDAIGTKTVETMTKRSVLESVS